MQKHSFCVYAIYVKIYAYEDLAYNLTLSKKGVSIQKLYFKSTEITNIKRNLPPGIDSQGTICQIVIHARVWHTQY
jgi:hypothetical protein